MSEVAGRRLNTKTPRLKGHQRQLVGWARRAGTRRVCFCFLKINRCDLQSCAMLGARLSELRVFESLCLIRFRGREAHELDHHFPVSRPVEFAELNPLPGA